MGRGKHTSKARAAAGKAAKKLAKRNARIALASTLCLLGVVMWFVVIPGITNGTITIPNPFGGPPIVVGQGVKLTGVVTFANTTSVTGQSIGGMDANGKIVYIAAVAAGTFLTNRGPTGGGAIRLFMTVTGCIVYVGVFQIPSSKDYSQESYNIGQIILYPRSQTFIAMLIGSATNTVVFTAGTGTAGTTGYAQSTGVDRTYTLRLENTLHFSCLFRQYTNPLYGIPVRPVFWIEVNRTTIYCNGITNMIGGQLTYKTWTNSTARIIAFELENVTDGVINVLKFWNFVLNSPNAGSFRFCAFMIDGSSLDHIYQAQSRVADPLSGETVTVNQLCNSILTVS